MIAYILIVILIFLSALFSGSEISYASSSEIKLRHLKESHPSKLNDLTYNIFDNYDEALVTILIGNNLVNIGSSAIATVIAIKLMGNSGAPLATAIMTILIIIFGEITPKIIASKNPETFAKMVAIPVSCLMVITLPIVRLVKKFMSFAAKFWTKDISGDEVTEGDLETIIDTAEEEEVIDEDTADLLQNAMDFDDVKAFEIITHRLDLDGIDIEDSKEKIIDKILNTQFSRLPIYKASLDDCLGFVVVDECIKALIKNEFDLNALTRRIIFVFKTTPLDDVLDLMRSENCHIAVVTDEYGGSMGIITMEDVLEQIVGEIWDEKDVVEEDFEKVRKDIYEVQGDMRIEDMFDELDFEDKDFESDNATVGGWAIEMLGDYPKVNDEFDYKNLHFTIKEMEDKRVTELRVKVTNHNIEEEKEQKTL